MTPEFLNRAKKNKADEFYTQLPDIEAELRHYKEQFKGKVVFCNCDDPYESNFFKYFAMNFNFLGLQKLISTCYTGSPVAGEQLSLFDIGSLAKQDLDAKRAYKIEIAEVRDENADGAIDLSDVEYLLKHGKNGLTLLNGDGDFRSSECIELLREADIVFTNPPFSLFREYVAQLVEYDKKFFILGDQNAIAYKEVFKFIKGNNIWLGYNNGGTRSYLDIFINRNDQLIGFHLRSCGAPQIGTLALKRLNCGSIYFGTLRRRFVEHKKALLYNKRPLNSSKDINT